MQSALIAPVGLLILLTFGQAMLPAIVKWFFSQYSDGSKPTLLEAMGPRDRAPEMSRFGKRAERAMANQIEALVMYLPALAISLSVGANTWTIWGIWLFLAARTVYVPSYLFGIFGLRSAAWTVGLIGMVITWASALL